MAPGKFPCTIDPQILFSSSNLHDFSFRMAYHNLKLKIPESGNLDFCNAYLVRESLYLAITDLTPKCQNTSGSYFNFLTPF